MIVTMLLYPTVVSKWTKEAETAETSKISCLFSEVPLHRNMIDSHQIREHTIKETTCSPNTNRSWLSAAKLRENWTCQHGEFRKEEMPNKNIPFWSVSGIIYRSHNTIALLLILIMKTSSSRHSKVQQLFSHPAPFKCLFFREWTRQRMCPGAKWK